MIQPVRYSSVLASILGLALTACAGPSGDQVFVEDAPTTMNFDSVSDALEMHCGTLDCHGNTSRNFRIYGIDGSRLAGSDVPGGNPTTSAEYAETYESIVSLQPEVLSEIVAQGGARPERFIVITKGRGTEHHKGGVRMNQGDATDVCITSWLTGTVNTDACTSATAVSPPSVNGF